MTTTTNLTWTINGHAFTLYNLHTNLLAETTHNLTNEAHAKGWDIEIKTHTH